MSVPYRDISQARSIDRRANRRARRRMHGVRIAEIDVSGVREILDRLEGDKKRGGEGKDDVCIKIPRFSAGKT